MKLAFSDDPALAASLFDLLDIVFPGLKRAADDTRALGGVWEAVSTPFVSVEGGRVVSHAGVIELPLVVLGEEARVGTVHAVATHPEHRGRGHYRRVMEELLDDSAKRFDTLLLTTEHPEYFEPFGFRRIVEHRFRARGAPAPGREGFRPLDLDDPRDLDRLHRLLGARVPVSDVVGVVREKAIFLFNEGRRPLAYAEDLDVIACMEIEGERLDLFDVVGRDIPPLSELLARIPVAVGEVAIHFSPDRLAAETDAEPRLFEHDGPSHLMMRGPFAAEGRPFALPRSART